MKDLNKLKGARTYRRQRRTRAQITGTTDKPRLSVFRSLLHISIQAIDDINGKTLAATSDKEVKTKGNKSEVALEVGKIMGDKLKAKKVNKAIFDKGAYK